KYKDPSTVYNVSPDLPGMTIRVAQYYARRAHDSLRCNGYSRVDMMLSNSGQFYVLEVNTAPGMTERSLVPLCAQAAQMSFEETLQAIIDASLHPRNAELQRPSDRLKAAIAKMAG
ncbi:MAG: hypothetical protein L6Q58_16535, partial [Rivicola pingtungensis]|nr:hypothetical protein [Rivihabitans pingtungensis]